MPATKKSNKSKVFLGGNKTTSKLKRLLAILTVALVVATAGSFAWSRYKSDDLKATAYRAWYNIYDANGGRYAVNACWADGDHVIFVFKIPRDRDQYKYTSSYADGRNPEQAVYQWWGGVVSAIKVEAENEHIIRVGFKENGVPLYPETVALSEYNIPDCGTNTAGPGGLPRWF